MLDGIVSGLVSGSAYAILAACVVVLYRLVGVLNFGQAGLGALGAYSCYSFVSAGMPLMLAVFSGLVIAGVTAGFAGWVLIRWFGEPTETARSVVAVVLLILLLTAGFRLFGDSPQVMPSLVPDVSYDIGGVRVLLTTLIALLAAVVIAGSLSVFMRYTQTGIRLQAMSERPTTVELLGVNSRLLAVSVWATTGVLSTFALLLIAPTRNPTFESMSFLVVPALAAGLLGKFSSVWIAVASGLVIGAVEGAGARITGLADYRGAIPFVIIITVLIWIRRREVWDAAR